MEFYSFAKAVFLFVMSFPLITILISISAEARMSVVKWDKLSGSASTDTSPSLLRSLARYFSFSWDEGVG